ncbi:c-type cytochrome [Paenalcaligenes sp. Me131]|uniref:c-type cytochrome n=1 Tax=Paenalcaligenes sp. Me131 TaxID=3392636 RepID=UPI003D2CA56D
MIRRYSFIALCLILAPQHAVIAQTSAHDVLELLKKNTCLACHRVDKKLLGPSFQSIFEAAPASVERAELLKTHIRRGSQGVWGPVAMPPNTKISDADLEIIVEWIVSGASEH